MISRLAAFVIWAAVAASLVFWAARLLATPAPLPSHAMLVATATTANGDLARLFGNTVSAAPVAAGRAAPVDTRYQLIGVVAPRSKAALDEGLAVIAFDGKPARAYRVGTAVDGELTLLAVHARGASLGPAGQASQVDLELPLMPPPTRGSLPPISGAAQPPSSQLPSQGMGGQAPEAEPDADAPPPPPATRRGSSARGQGPV